MWEIYVRDVLNLSKICKRCAEYEKNYKRDVLKFRKVCKRCAEEKENIEEMYCMWELFERCDECEKIM